MKSGLLVLVVVLLGVHTIAATPQSPYDSRRSIAPAIEASIEQTLQRYASGDDLAVRRWFQAGDGVVAMPSIEAFMLRRRATWNRTTAMFVLEAVISNPDRQVFRGPPLLSLGRTMLVMPTQAAGPPPASSVRVALASDGARRRAGDAPVRGPAGIPGRHRHATRGGRSPRIRRRDARAPGTRRRRLRTLLLEGLSQAPSSSEPMPGQRRSMSLDDALRLFTRAAEHPWLASESLIRGGVALQAADRSAEAVAWFARVPPGEDSALGYVHHLNYARALETTGQTADAAAEYALAVDFAPAGQIASIGLAASLLRLGRTEEASRRAAETRRLPADPVDHVAQFERADARFIPIWLAALRKLRAS